MSLTYKQAGVDVAGADDFVSRIGKHVATTHGKNVVQHFSKYAGLIRPAPGSKQLIAATCDGVGTKLLVAREAKMYDGLGQDLVAMSVNDLLPLGAKPLLFLDYIAVGKLAPEVMERIVAGIAGACRESGCALLGGETAEMPGVYAPDDFDLAGFAVGTVDEDKLPKPDAMAVGDIVLGLPSTGVHSNGFSLARAALKNGKLALTDKPDALLGETLAQALLAPTALYVRPLLALLDKVELRAAAHITGGGLLGRGEKLVAGNKLVIDPTAYARPPIFDVLQKAGGIADAEMARTFNLGLGFLVVLSPADARTALAQNLGFLEVGRIADGHGVDLGYASAA